MGDPIIERALAARLARLSRRADDPLPVAL
jgi:hypothetical protein